MAARTVSEFANWDGRLDQHRQNSKWRRSSSSLARDSYHTPLENRPFEIFQHPGTFSDQKRAEQSASRSNLERDAVANPPESARLPSRVDTTSTPSYDMHHYHHPSISHSVQNTALPPSPFIAPSKSSHFTPDSSVHASRVHNSRPPSSRKHTALLQPTSATKSEVIDLTIEDTEDELSVSEMLAPNKVYFSNQCADPGPSRRPSSSGHSSPIALQQSLFTPPPPPRRRTRLFVAVPAFPKGLTKVDYLPIPDHSVMPLSGPTVISTLKDSCPAESSVTKERTLSPQKWTRKEREHDVVSSRKKHKRRAHPNERGVAPSASLDAFYELTRIPLHDAENYPPLTTLDLATNTRFRFAHAWRGYASRLHAPEFDWMSKFRPLGRACIWVRSVDASSPRIPGTAGYVSSEQLQSWELVLPDSSPQEKSSKRSSDEQADATGSHSVVGVDSNYLSLPDDTLPGSTVAFDPAVSNPTLSQSFSSTGVDLEHDMNQYFNGFSDSPNKHIPPRQQPAPTYTFRPHLLQSAGHAQIDSLGLGFPPSELDLRLADTGGHECFLGVPPSPTTADMESSIALTTDSPFEPVNYLTASPSNVFAGEAPSTDVWSFEQGEGLLPRDNPPPNNHAPPAALGTIDPSLLGPEQPQTPSRPPKDTSPKRRSKLPEPVIYMRRPIDSSTLPLVSGKRSVQIKYRDPGGSPATSSTQSVSKQASSNPVEHPAELSTIDTDDYRRTKRVLAPLGKLREYHTASESDSDYIPETSKVDPKPKLKLKLKRPSVGDKKSVAENQGTDTGTVPTMTSCHQCRNRSQRPKMLCSNPVSGRVCGKRFCNRCILNRYPDITFDQHSAGFLCPACTNTCNCSLCSRNRGEEYVSMRLGGQAASIFKTKVTLVRDAGKSLGSVESSTRKGVDARRSASEVTTPTPEPGVLLPTQSHFWAHVYGMEGERVGSAFMTREHMEHLQTRVPSPPPPPPPPPPPLKRPRPKQVEKPRRREKKREKTRVGPRVFVGRPLESWKVREVRDLEPSVDVETIRRDEGKGKGQGAADDHLVPVPASIAPRRRRCYIGNSAPLYEPYGRMPGTASATPPSSRCSSPMLDSDRSRSLTPLSELDAEAAAAAAYWPQPEVGECCAWAPPPSGTIVCGLSSDSDGLVGSFAGGLLGSGIPGAVGMGTDVVEGQDQRLGSGADVDMGMGMDVAANGDAEGSASTSMSEQDVARAISAALAALSVAFPS